MPQASMPTITSCGVLQAADYVQGCRASPSMEGGTRDTQGQLFLLVSDIRSHKIFSKRALFLERGVESHPCCRYDILSPGEMQRLSFARLFYLQPKYAGE